MANITINGGSALGNSLQSLLMCEDIVPGSAPSYQICKEIFVYHPLGAKMAESPIRMAQSQQREITIPAAPESMVVEAFEREWEAISADRHIFNVGRTARIYGIASVAILAEDVPPAEPLDYTKLYNMKIGFNVLDPLNTAGSLVLNQNPNAIDFQKHAAIAIAGVPYHRSRSCTILNEDPLYIEYTPSAFGFVGRSVYQRALFPLKSFIQSMVTDDMVTRKAGLIIAMMKQVSSIVDNVQTRLFGQKRDLLKEGVTNNVLGIGIDEKIETINMQNLDGAYGMARTNVVQNIATAADMPAILLNHETFAEGFGEGTEDAKYVAQYIDRVRIDLQPLYKFFDPIVMHRAWNVDFYKDVQRAFPEYQNVEYETAFQQWKSSFTAIWPSLLREPDSEKIKVDDVKLKAIIAAIEVFGPMVPAEQKAKLLEFAQDNFNEMKLLFEHPLDLDFQAIAAYEPATPVEEPNEPKPFAATDSEPKRRPKVSFSAYDDALRRLTMKDGLPVA